jgi:hypothetical protein
LSTAGLLHNNFPQVRLGDLTLPCLLGGIGYPALAIGTIPFAVRFLRAYVAQQSRKVSEDVSQEPEVEGTTFGQPLVDAGK